MSKHALDLWLSSFSSVNTQRAYRREIELFASFSGCNGLNKAVADFLALDNGSAHAAVDTWRSYKLSCGLSPASINRSMAALNSFIAYARRSRWTAILLEAESVKNNQCRDMSGPSISEINKLIRTAGNQKNVRKAARDVSILNLAFGIGLRRGEIATLDVDHIDLKEGKLSVLGKGRSERETLMFPSEIGSALAAWIDVRGDVDGQALFVGLSTGEPSDRLTGGGIYHLVLWLGKKAGVNVRPHGLRHSAVTAALEAFDGDHRKVMAFCRHKSFDAARCYDDNSGNYNNNRADHGKQVATVLTSLIEKNQKEESHKA